MKKQLLSIAVLAFTTAAYGQVGINTTTPGTTLDITAKNPTGTTTAVDGLMIPRVDRQRAQSMNSVPTSTMIYVNDISTGAASGTAVNIDAVGFYYYNGIAWVKMGSGSAAAVTANNGLTQTSGNIKLGGALTQPTTVSGLTATNNLAFTGTGANAFSVDGTTFSVDASNHFIGLGTTTPNTRVAIVGDGGGGDDVSITSMGSTGNGQIDFKKSLGTIAAPAAVSTGSSLGLLQFFGHDGTNFLVRARVSAAVNGTVSTGSVPTDLYFSTGSNGVTERMRISSAGNVGIATTAPASTLDITAKAATGTGTDVDGILIPRVSRERAGSMTSVPVSTLIYVSEVTTTSASATAVNIDAVGFYYFNGTAWQKLGASATAAPLNVTSEKTTDYTALPTDDIILFKTSAPQVLTLPTSGIPIGKKYYISSDATSQGSVTFAPASVLRNNVTEVQAGASGTIIYLGGGKWDIVSGY